MTNFNLSILLILFLMAVFILISILMKNYLLIMANKYQFLENRNNLLLQSLKNFREIKIFNIQNIIKILFKSMSQN